MDKSAPATQAADWLPLIRIRYLQESDLPGLEWDGEFTHFRRLYADAFQRMQKQLAVHWVADLPGVGIIGQVFVQLTCDRPELADGYQRAYLYSFRIRPAYRDHGLGSRIMEAVEEDIRRKQFRVITLNVAKDNLDAQRLYRRRGYYIVAHEPGIWSYPDQDGVWHHIEEPAWRMEKQLRR
jgi:ribosomal protein S18 acetylase RimI-like enzyme